jgi:hypothetical protein
MPGSGEPRTRGRRVKVGSQPGIVGSRATIHFGVDVEIAVR